MKTIQEHQECSTHSLQTQRRIDSVVQDRDLCHPSPVDVALLPVDLFLEKDEIGFCWCFSKGWWWKAGWQHSKGSCLVLLQAPNQAKSRFVSAAVGKACITQTSIAGKKLYLTSFTAPGHQNLSPCLKVFLVNILSEKNIRIFVIWGKNVFVILRNNQNLLYSGWDSCQDRANVTSDDIWQSYKQLKTRLCSRQSLFCWHCIVKYCIFTVECCFLHWSSLCSNNPVKDGVLFFLEWLSISLSDNGQNSAESSVTFPAPPPFGNSLVKVPLKIHTALLPVARVLRDLGRDDITAKNYLVPSVSLGVTCWAVICC